MKAKTDTTYLIEGQPKLATLDSPVRQEILDAIHALGACTVAEIAELLNRAPDSLYYHLKILLNVELVRETGVRQSGLRPETLFDIPGRPMRIKYSADPDVREAIGRIVSGLLRLTDRDFRAVVRQRETLRGDGATVLTGGRTKAWLAPEQISSINNLLQEIETIMASGRKAPDTHLMAFARVLIPLAESRRIRTPQRASKTQKDS